MAPQRLARAAARHLPLLAIVILCLSGQTAAQVAPAQKWTILVYMLADNDLDCAGMVNLEVRGPVAQLGPACLNSI
jgi:hypothetical protein